MQRRMGICEALMHQKEAFLIVGDSTDKISSGIARSNVSSKIALVNLLKVVEISLLQCLSPLANPGDIRMLIVESD